MTAAKANSTDDGKRLQPIIFWGASGQAKVLREFIGYLGYQLVATFDNNQDIPPPFPDVPVFIGENGFLRWREENPSLQAAGLVAIGSARGRIRLELQKFFQKHGIRPVSVTHPTAFVAKDAVLGAGSQVLAQAVVGAEARLGQVCIVNTAASVDHECVLGDGVHLAPRATLAGGVQVGDFSMIAMGAMVLPRIRIGRNVIVGAGAVVTRDLPDNTVAFGSPARVRRQNEV